MQHPFSALAPEYEKLLASAKVQPSRRAEVNGVCRRLLKDKAVYCIIAEKTSVPAAFIMALNEREDSGRLDRYLGNGQPLNRKTTLVPKGRGPFIAQPPQNFIDGALDALHLDGLDAAGAKHGGWTWPLMAYEAELWNGFGYRARGIPSPYVFGATTVQRAGKFVADHVYSSSTMDPQLGVIAIVEGLIALDQSLSIDAAPARAPDADSLPDHVVAQAPEGLGGSVAGVKVLQADLNKLGFGPIDVDGSYGRETRAAVRAFQIKHGLQADGYAGRQTLPVLMAAAA